VFLGNDLRKNLGWINRESGPKEEELNNLHVLKFKNSKCSSYLLFTAHLQRLVCEKRSDSFAMLILHLRTEKAATVGVFGALGTRLNTFVFPIRN